ncbi:MAG: hypothetical protein M1275_01795 [Patescibacteria group bacterium]|nr:hypothetical protein [Patescibacteria group bacterium]
MLGGSYYTANPLPDGVLFKEFVKGISQSWLDSALDGLDTTPVCDDRPGSRVWYFVLYKAHTLVGIIIPRGSDRTVVAAMLRAQFGPDSALHFQRFPRDHEAHLVVQPASPAAQVHA